MSLYSGSSPSYNIAGEDGDFQVLGIQRIIWITDEEQCQAEVELDRHPLSNCGSAASVEWAPVSKESV